jgi:hypothetical protein
MPIFAYQYSKEAFLIYITDRLKAGDSERNEVKG